LTNIAFNIFQYLLSIFLQCVHKCWNYLFHQNEKDLNIEGVLEGETARITGIVKF